MVLGSGTQVASLYAVLSLRDDMTRQLQGSRRELSGMTDSLRGVGTIALATGAAVGAAFVGASAAGLNEFRKFQSGMNEVFTLLPGISQRAMDGMSLQMQYFASEMGVLTTDAVPALYQALSAGVPQNNVFDFMETAFKASVGGVTDMETAVDGLTTMMNVYGHENMSATQASDLMFTTVRLGKTTFDELSRSMFQMLPVLEGVGAGADVGLAAIAALTAQGRPTSVAMTQVRQALVELADGTKGVGETFEQVSGESFRGFIEGGGDLGQAMALLEEHAAASGMSIDQLFSTVEAGGAALALTGTGAELYADALLEMAEAAGATDEAFDTMNRGIGRALQTLLSRAQVALQHLGSLFEPTAASAVNAFSSVIDVLNTAFGGDYDITELVSRLPRVLQPLGVSMVAAVENFRDMARLLPDIIGVLRGGAPSVAHFGNLMAAGVSDDMLRNVRTMRTRLRDLTSTIRGIVTPVFDFVRSFVSLRDVLTAVGISIAMVVVPILFAIAAPIASAVAAFAALTGVIALVRQAFETDFMGVRTAIEGTLIPAVANGVSVVRGTIDTLINAFGDGGFAGVFSVISQAIGSALSDIQNRITSIDLGNVLSGIGDALMSALSTGAGLVSGAAAWVYDNVIVPIANAIRSFVEDGGLADAASKLGAAITKLLAAGVGLLSTAAAWVNTNIISPVASAILGYVTGGGLADAARQVGAAIPKLIAGGIGLVGAAAEWVSENILRPIWSALISERFAGNLKTHAESLGAAIPGMIAAGLNLLATGAEWVQVNLISPVGAAIKGYITSGALMDNLRALGAAIPGAFARGIMLIETAAEWVNTNILRPIWTEIISARFGGNLKDQTEALGAELPNMLARGVDLVNTAVVWVRNNIVTPIAEKLNELADDEALSGAAQTLGYAIPEFVGNAAKEIFNLDRWVGEVIRGPLNSNLSNTENHPNVVMAAINLGQSIAHNIGVGLRNWLIDMIIPQFIQDAVNSARNAIADQATPSVPGTHGFIGTPGSGGLGVGFSEISVGNQAGTPWTGSGAINAIAGYVHNQEAVVPAHGMRVVPSPGGLMLEGGGGSGGRPIIIQNATFNGVENIHDLYDQLQREARRSGC